MTVPNHSAMRRAFELAGVEFIDENGGGPGVRLRKRHQSRKLLETPLRWWISPMRGECRISGFGQDGQLGPIIQSKVRF